VILLDTSGLLAALDSAQRHHAASAASLLGAKPPLLLSPFVLAELDFLLARRVGEAARMKLLAEVGRSAYQVQTFTAPEVERARAIIERHADLGVSLADASIAVLAAAHKTHDVLTLDERHFRVLTVDGEPFRLLPADG
jgi:uncharacterized protein